MLNIEDLACSKELGRAERAAVRGGSNAAFVLGPWQYAQNGGGFSNGSPVAQSAPQTVTQGDTTVDIASVLASMNTGVGQLKFL